MSLAFAVLDPSLAPKPSMTSCVPTGTEFLFKPRLINAFGALHSMVQLTTWPSGPSTFRRLDSGIRVRGPTPNHSRAAALSLPIARLVRDDEIGAPIVRAPMNAQAATTVAIGHQRCPQGPCGGPTLAVLEVDLDGIEVWIVLRSPRVGFVVEDELPSATAPLEPETIGAGKVGCQVLGRHRDVVEIALPTPLCRRVVPEVDLDACSLRQQLRLL